MVGSVYFVKYYPLPIPVGELKIPLFLNIKSTRFITREDEGMSYELCVSVVNARKITGIKKLTEKIFLTYASSKVLRALLRKLVYSRSRSIIRTQSNYSIIDV